MSSLPLAFPRLATARSAFSALVLVFVAIVAAIPRECAAAIPLFTPGMTCQAPVRELASSDFNGDSIPDLVITQSDSTSLWFGNGDGTFRHGGRLDVAIHNFATVDIEAADLDHDGRQDLIVAAIDLSVSLGLGDGTFRPRRSYTSVNNQCRGFALGDMDVDGQLDIVALIDTTRTSHPFATTHFMRIWYGNGDGTFRDVVMSYDIGALQGDIAIGDVNEDGRPDVVTIVEGYAVPRQISVMIANADGTLGSPLRYDQFFRPGTLALADVNEDGHLDIVTDQEGGQNCCSTYHGVISVYPGDGSGAFVTHQEFAVPGSSIGVGVADLNGDGRNDIISGVLSSSGFPNNILAASVSVLLREPGGFASRIDLDLGSGFGVHISGKFVASDLNRDGFIDLGAYGYPTHNAGTHFTAFLNRGCDPLSKSITAVFPARGGDAGLLTATIYGCGFESGAIPRLTRPGELDIVGGSVAPLADGAIRAVFDLSGRSQGLWDVEVRNPDDSRALRPNGFTIEAGIPAEVHVWVEGRTEHHPGAPIENKILAQDPGGNNDFNGWASVCIVNNSCATTAKLYYKDALGVEHELGDLTPPTTGVYTLPWSISGGIEVKHFYSIKGPASGAEHPDCVETGFIQTTVFQGAVTTDNGCGAAPSPGATVIARHSSGNRGHGLLYEYWNSHANTGCVGDLDGAFEDQLREKVCQKIKLLTDLFVGNVASNTQGVSETPSLGGGGTVHLAHTDELILEAVTRALNDLATTYGPEVTQYRACLALIDRATFKNSICDLFSSLDFGLDHADAVPEKWKTPSDPYKVDCRSGNACDPNGKGGPNGVGAGGHILGDIPLNYTVYFENKPTALFSAVHVLISDQLDPAKVDLTTFRLSSITFGDRVVTPVPGLNPYITEVDLRPGLNLKVRIIAQMNVTTGLLTVRYLAIDPVTGLEPTDASLGFLPPNVNPPEGDGSISFTVMPREDVLSGVEIRNSASIVFDTNAPIVTNERLNTIDRAAPSSRVDALIPVPGQGTKILAHWSGSDGFGSGIGKYLIYASDNGAPYELWRATTAQQDTFPGEIGHTYGFYSIARDMVGNEEDAPNPLVADTTFTVSASMVAMGFDFTPGTLNLRSMSRWVTGYLEPPAPFTPAQIDTPTLRLNGGLPVDPDAPVAIGDYDGDGISDLMVKFSRAQFDLTVSAGDSVPVTVTGTVAGNSFSGVDYVRVIRAVVTAPASGTILPAGGVTTVRWTTPSGVSIQSVALLSSIDDGLTWNLDAQGLPNTGSADWIAPATATDQGKVAVVLVESADETGYLIDGVLGTSGTFTIGNITGVDAGAKAEFALRVVRPNPTQENLRIVFGLAEARPAKLEVFNVSGRLVASQEVGSMGIGFHTVTLGGRANLASGVYLVRLTQGAKRLTTRAVLVR